MSPHPRADIADPIKASMVHSLSEIAIEMIPTLRPADALTVRTSKAGQPLMSVLVGDDRRGVHEVSRTESGQITLTTLSRRHNEQRMIGWRPAAAAPLLAGIRHDIEQRATERWGADNIEQVRQCRRIGGAWLRALNDEAQKLGRLMIGNEGFDTLTRNVNAEMRASFIDRKAQERAVRIKTILHPQRNIRRQDVTFWEHNAALVAGEALLAMLGDRREAAFAKAYWADHIECGQHAATPAQISEAVRRRLSLDDCAESAFRLVEHRTGDRDLGAIRRATALVGSAMGPDTQEAAVQEAYDASLGIWQTATSHGFQEQWAAWSETVRATLPVGQTSPGIMREIATKFHIWRDAGWIWEPGDYADYVSRKRNRITEASGRPRAAEADDRAILHFALHSVNIEGTELGAVTSAAEMARLEVALGLALGEQWERCRAQQERLFAAREDGEVTGAATIQRAGDGWAAREITGPWNHWRTRSRARYAADRLAVLYGAAEVAERRQVGLSNRD